MSPMRSRCNSCNRPFSTRATRLSDGVTLISSSLLMVAHGECSWLFLGIIYALAKAACEHRRSGKPASIPHQAGVTKQVGGFEQRQPDHTAVASFEIGNPGRRPALDRIAAGLVQRLA